MALERVAHFVPPVAQVIAPDVDQAEADAAVVASDEAVQFMPPETQTEVAMTTTSPAGSNTAMVASEGVAQSAPPAAQAAVPGAVKMEEDMAKGLRASWRWWKGPTEGRPWPYCRGAAAPPRGASRRSSGCPLRTQHRFFFHSMMLPRAWSGRTLTSGSRL